MCCCLLCVMLAKKLFSFTILSWITDQSHQLQLLGEQSFHTKQPLHVFFSGTETKKRKEKAVSEHSENKYRPKKDIFLQGLIECSCLVPHSHPYMNKQQPFSVDKHRHTQRHADVLCSRKTASGNLS